MRTKNIVTALLAVSIYVATSCSKDKKECLECKAICSGTSVSDLNYCGDGLDQQEADYRAENPGCDVTCTRK